MGDEPQQANINDTNLSGMSDNLEEFLKSWADDETDPADTAKMLHAPEGAPYQGWLPQELFAAFTSGALNPEFMSMACNRTLGSQEEIGAWLGSVWQSWFDQPFPAQQQPQAPAPTEPTA
jgi:hypothetical protein